MKRIIFKKGINIICVPMLASFELQKIVTEEKDKFLKRYKINKTAEISFEYKGGNVCEILIKK